MVQNGTKMATAFGYAEIIIRVSSDHIPAVSVVRATPFAKAESTHGRTKSPQKLQKDPFCDQLTPLPDPKRRVRRGGQGRKMPRKTLFSDPCPFQGQQTARPSQTGSLQQRMEQQWAKPHGRCQIDLAQAGHTVRPAGQLHPPLARWIIKGCPPRHFFPPRSLP